ncbi:MAG TPA: TlpA disulfide reductase family protein, partial [Flavobacteriaceae bacterium]
MHEKFSFEGKVLGPEMFFLYVNSVNGNLPIIIENSEMTIDIDKDNLASSIVHGSKTNEALNAYNEQLKGLNDKRREISLALREAAQTNDNEKTALLNKDLAEINLQMANKPFEFVQDHGDNFYSLILLESMLKRKNEDLQKVIDTYQGLDETLKASTKGKEILAQIENIKIILEAQKRTEIGEIAPEFSAPTPEGKMLGLNDIKGKVTLIDFWAAWCGPCRRENPNIVKVYEKYHDKGLEIIGVSLDGNMRQTDPKAAWVKAIEDDRLTWHQVSNLNYFNGPIAKMYNIQSIPSSFILDAEGKIIAKNLRGPALEAKIAELLD